MKATNTYVGAHIERVEDDRFLRGIGQYLDDLTREGTWHAAVFRSPVGHGRILGINADEALAMPGVHAIITAADVDGPIPVIPFRRPNPTIGPYAQPVIARDIVRYYGEPIALVVADTPELAEDALTGILVDIETFPAVTTRDASVTGETLLFEATGTNVVSTFTAEQGDVDAAFRDAHVIVGDSFSTQRQTALPMETRGLLAEWDGTTGRLVMHGAAKLPFFNRRALAKMMKLPETAVDYVEVDVGGGFGARGEFYPEDFLVALAARRTGHPIKWVEDRREHLMTIAHARQSEGTFELALARDGTMLGLRGTMYFDIGAYVRPNGMTPVRNATQFMAGAYRIPAIDITGHAILSNKTPAGTYRGPGRYESCFFIERLVELGAAALGLDRLALRRQNLLTAAEMPYPIVSVLPFDGLGEQQCDSGDYREAFDRCLLDFDWAGKAHLDGRQIEGLYHGLGIACFIEGGASGPSEAARLEVELDGTVSVYVGSSSIGQGLETIISQIAADALELPMDRIRVYHGSTTYLKEGWGSYGSRATVMGGSAVLRAAETLVARFRTVAAERLGVAEDEVTIADGIARHADGRNVPLAEAARFGIASEARFDNATSTYTYGTAAVHVAVDIGTGHVQVLDYLACDDVGRVINPLTLHGQVMGAAVQGFGSVFGEELVYDADGTLLVGTLADYVMPVATQFPHVHCVSLESYPSPTNPLGAKGAGEGGIIPTGGAIANAVASALRDFAVRTNHMPLSPWKVWELVQNASTP
jgi:carbon-monoxide dehydrogenase large subunit